MHRGSENLPTFVNMKFFGKIMISIVASVVAGSVTGVSAAVHEADVCVYGGTSAGVIAAYSTAMSGKSVVLIEPGSHLGGMSSGGLGYTDIGNKFVVTGLARDFYRRIGSHYGQLEQWVFEPSVAEAIFDDYIARAGIDVLYGRAVDRAVVRGGHIEEITLADMTAGGDDGDVVRAREYIDCSYEGDLMARSGVSYTVGREDNATYGERYNGVQVPERNHQFRDPVDPYVVPGDASSGLLWGINPGGVEAQGTGDRKVQAYCFRICLTDSVANMIPITRPQDYDPMRYELLARLMEVTPEPTLDKFFIWSRMPGSKTDINNRGGFSTDMIGANWDYPDADYSRRAVIVKEHENYTKGLLYFMGHDSRVPLNVRAEMLRWGYPADEYVDNGHWSPQLYVREARRMVGETVMTEAHCIGEKVAGDPVGWAAYTMDSHNCDRTVIDGRVVNEGNVEVGGFPPFPISYRSIVPRCGEADNLLVPVCLSASHIAYGSIRMEPVFMVLAQAAAIAACEAIDSGCPVQAVDAGKVSRIMADNPMLDGSVPETVVDNSDAVISGSWRLVKDAKRAYGPDYYVSGDSCTAGEIRFVPELRSEGSFDVYVYVPRVAGMSTVMTFDIFDGSVSHRREVRPARTAVLGQAYGEWVSLGTYELTSGSQVILSAGGADGNVVADAVLFKPRKQ